ncbi:MAG: hypothetical protein K2J31_05145 [Alistipes sp.]|nr:hypothetical protein [Alistipes sp.]
MLGDLQHGYWPYIRLCGGLSHDGGFSLISCIFLRHKQVMNTLMNLDAAVAGQYIV